MVASGPNDAAGWVKLGETHLRSGRLHDGLVAFVRALSLRPDHDEAWRSVGRLVQDQAERRAPARRSPPGWYSSRHPRFARGVEAAFRDMWRRWCA